MTKQELANKKSSEVRNNTTLFSLFKSFLIEDWGSIPSGCFGCEFNKNFERWARPHRENKSVEPLKPKRKMEGFLLKDENYKTYHKGEVLSKNSSADEWTDFIFANEKQIEQRKALFLVLPSEVSTDEQKVAEEIIVAEIEEKKSENLTQVVVADVEEIQEELSLDVNPQITDAVTQLDVIEKLPKEKSNAKK